VRNPVLLALLLLIAGMCLPAQSAKSSAVPTSDKNSDLTTLTGCIQSSSARYTLTDENGDTHELSSGRKVRDNVGKQVEITGKEVTRTVDMTPPGGASSVVVQSVFEVKTVKRIADECK